MPSPNTSNPNSLKKGFTLIEILVSIAILTVILGLGLFMSIDSYRAYLSRSERDTLVTLLEKARSRAMANIDQAPWGLCYDAAGGNYIIFPNTYSAGAPQNEPTAASADASLTASPNTFACSAGGVSFAELSGDSPALALTVVQQGRTQNISINHESTIIW